MNCTSAQRPWKIGVIAPEVHTVCVVYLLWPVPSSLKVLLAGESFMA